ncbi:MAG: cytochrome c [Deltaproteobacteria bacterium]|nr:cytochrome c [Deltaproteobacteria bacterium]
MRNNKRNYWITCFIIFISMTFSFSVYGEVISKKGEPEEIALFKDASAENGKKLFIKFKCTKCHGDDGKGIFCKNTKKSKKTGAYLCVKGKIDPEFEAYPRIGGQQKIYLFKQMKNIVYGLRENSHAKTMFKEFQKQHLLEKSIDTERILKDMATYLGSVK